MLLILVIASATFLEGELANARLQQLEHSRQALLLEEAGTPVPILKRISGDYERSAEWSQNALRVLRVGMGGLLLIAIWSVWELSAKPVNQVEIVACWISPMLLLVVFDLLSPWNGWLFVFIASVIEASVRLSIRKIRQQSGYELTVSSTESFVGWDVAVVLSGAILAYVGAAMKIDSSWLIRTCLLVILFTGVSTMVHFVSLFKLGLELRTLIRR